MIAEGGKVMLIGVVVGRGRGYGAAGERRHEMHRDNNGQR